MWRGSVKKVHNVQHVTCMCSMLPAPGLKRLKILVTSCVTPNDLMPKSVDQWYFCADFDFVLTSNLQELVVMLSGCFTVPSHARCPACKVSPQVPLLLLLLLLLLRGGGGLGAGFGFMV